jgi:hypothetical protein
MRRFAWLLSAILCVVGLSAVALSGNHAFVGGTGANIDEPALGSDVEPDQASSGGAIVGDGLRPAFRFSTSRHVPLTDGGGMAETDDQNVLVSGSLHGDLGRVKPVVRVRRLNFL